MPVRTTVDIPEPLHDRLRRRAESSGTSIRSLIVRALEETYTEQKKGERVTGPMIRTKGKLGPRFPVDENPYDLIFP
jgi:metal-responsive CopG/Arc/MetJ family transcriptional regulator